MVSSDERRFEGDGPVNPQADLRQRVSSALIGRSGIIAADTISMFPYAGAEALDFEFCARLGQLVVDLLASAIRDGCLDPRGGSVAGLRALVRERSLSIDQLFTLAYLTERTALDELALSETIGATREAWPLVAQLARRASFDVLAAYATGALLDPAGATVTDKLTTLSSRPVFDVVLVKEVERASRFGYPLSLILFDVDRLATINDGHGYGVGDRILERLGILIRTYFRQHDWVARLGDDAIAVLLTGPDAEHASELAERVRATVEERLGLTDHRTDAAVAVTISAAVVNVPGGAGASIDPERLLTEAEAALDRAKQLGRNRVESVGGSSISRTHPHSSPSA